MISFIVPAHNEEHLLGATVQAIRRASLPLVEPFEILVVDDASTDRTAVVAAEEGVTVLSVAHRQIAATRDAGARTAVGDVLIFVDADTIVTAPVVGAAVALVRGGAVGGAAIGIFDGELPLYARVLAMVWIRVARFAHLTTGCFLFCSRDAYEAVGGFDLTLYVFEDVAFGRALRRLGRVVLLRETVSTSGRNLRAHSLTDLGRMLLTLVRTRRQFFRSRSGLDYWYAGR